MGTRHVTMVKSDGELKVAQYGQWDGYPTGQGATIVNFLKEVNLEKFKEKLKHVRFLTKEETKEIENKYSSNGWMSLEQSDIFKKEHPELHRDTGAEILQLIYDSEEEVALTNSESFLVAFGCEWAYLLDMDTQQLTIFNNGDTNIVFQDSFEVINHDILEALENEEKET